MMLAVLPVGTPGAIALGVAALVLLWLALKAAKFVMKIVLTLVAVGALVLAVWWYYTT